MIQLQVVERGKRRPILGVAWIFGAVACWLFRPKNFAAYGIGWRRVAVGIRLTPEAYNRPIENGKVKDQVRFNGQVEGDSGAA